jgi:hypothetical protein
MTVTNVLRELLAVRELRAEYMRQKQRRAVKFRRDLAQVAEADRLKAELDVREPAAWKMAEDVLRIQGD